MSATEVVIRTPFRCAGCGGEFFDTHSCPVMPWGNTAPLPIYVPIGRAFTYSRRATSYGSFGAPRESEEGQRNE